MSRTQLGFICSFVAAVAWGCVAWVLVTRDVDAAAWMLLGIDAAVVVIVVATAALVLSVIREQRARGCLGRRSRRLLIGTPRALAFAFIAFLSLFALDVLGQGYPLGHVLLGLLMHLLPSLILLAAVVSGWRREWVGSIAFGVWAAWCLLRYGMGSSLLSLLMVGLPLIVAVLFLLAWLYRTQRAPAIVDWLLGQGRS